MPAPNLDLTNAIKELCKILGDTTLLCGDVVSIYEGVAALPDLESTTDLPIIAVQAIDDFSFINNGSVAVRSLEGKIPYYIWIITCDPSPVGVATTDVLRYDLDKISKLLWDEDLGGNVDDIDIIAMNWSENNEINSFILEHRLQLIAGRLTIVLNKRIDI